MHLRPPSLCELEISLQGVKLIMSLEDEYDLSEEVRQREKERKKRVLCISEQTDSQTEVLF